MSVTFLASECSVSCADPDTTAEEQQTCNDQCLEYHQGLGVDHVMPAWQELAAEAKKTTAKK